MKFLSFIFISFLLFSDPVLEHARWLYKNGLCYQAITEYKRFIFFNPQFKNKGKIFYRIGVCLRKEGNINQALEYMKRSMAEGYKKAFLTTGVTLIAEGDYDGARAILYYARRFPEVKREATFYSGIANLMDGNYKIALDELKETLGNRGKEIFVKIEKLEHRKSPELAAFLSRMFPGAGQLYAGSFKDFIAGIFTSGVTLYFLGYHVAHEKFIEAILIYSPLFQRYYIGGEKRAAQIVREKELRKRKSLALMALSIFAEGQKNDYLNKFCP